jgi:cytochrome c1
VIAEKLTSKTIDLPSWSAIESPLESGDSQTIEKEGVKVNLTNFDKSKNQTTLGTRSLLTVDKGGQVIFKKSFSGKCTDCKQVNQDHWKESLRIEDVQADLILLTQFLVEVDDSGKPLNPEQLKSSILVNTKTHKVTHLDCGGNDESYAAKLKEGSYVCKVEGIIREEVEKPLPKI